jgi:uncharacterized protein (TIGR03086 family)
MDPLDLFDRGSAWAKEKIEGAKDKLDAKTPCEEWKVRDVISHLIDGQQGYFQPAARGEEATPPSPNPPDLVDGDPAAEYEKARQATLNAFRKADANQAGMTMGIAFVDQVVHGTDLAKATGQDATIPADLAEAAFGMVNGRITDENRGKAFKPEIDVPDDARTQDKLLAYLGRKP